MALLDDVGVYLAAQGVGTQGTDIFIGKMPDTPDTCIGLFEYGGQEGDYTMGATVSARMERPNFQAVVRAAGYSAARTKVQSVYTTLDAVAEQDLSSKRYHRISAKAPPIYLGRDKSNRPQFSCNFGVIKDV